MLLNTLFGLTNFITSAAAVFTNMYILINFIPDEFEINDPPRAHKKIKTMAPFVELVKEIPELLILLIISIKTSLIATFLNE